MPVPLAVAPSTKKPGLYLTVDLLGANANPGLATLRGLLLAPKGTAGNITANTEIREVFGPDDVATSHGAGTPGHLAAKRLFGHYGLLSLDVGAPTASAGSAATGVQTFTGTATVNSTISFRVHGRVIEVPWNAGETATAFGTRAAATINSFGADLAVTVAAATGSLTYTHKVAGPWGNDVKINASITAGGTGITISANPAALTGGTTEPDFTTILALVQTREYRRILVCLSNADATLNTASSNAARLAAHIASVASGSAAKLQVGVVGHTGVIADVQAGAVGRNSERMQYVFGQNFEDLPCEVAAAEMADAMRFVSQRANFNRIGNPLTLYGPRDTAADKLTDTEAESLLGAGVSPLDIEPRSRQVYTVRPITTRSLNGTAPDFRAFDMSGVDGTFHVASDLRGTLPVEFANASITEDLPPTVQRLPPGVVERRDVEAFVLSRLEAAVQLGIVDAGKLAARILGGELQVSINKVDDTQVDIFVPTDVIKVLAKLGVVVSKRS